MSDTTQKIKDKLPIEDVVSQYVKLESSGKNLRGKCPFHNEKTPSFFVSPDRGSYYCFGCGAKGDIFNFVEEFEGLDFKGALKLLADRAGVEIQKEDPKKADERQTIYTALEEATKYFEEQLKEEGDAYKYLEERGLEASTIKTFRLGYALPEWRALKNHLEMQGFQEKDLVKSGLIVEKDGNSYDRFRGRIMFPIMDPSGRVIAFSGRVFPESEDEMGAKYVNTPETEVFHKGNVLYGYDKAKVYIRKYDFSIIVEGQTDLLMSVQAGYRNTVASSGTALTKSHFEKLNRISSNIVLALDADSAGEASTTRSAIDALALGMDLKVAKLPADSDPADIIKENPEDWRGIVKNAVHIVDFKLQSIFEQEELDRKRLKLVSKEVLPFIKSIENKIEQAHFVKKVSDELSVSEDSIMEEISKVEGFASRDERGAEIAGSRTGGGRSQTEARIRDFISWQKSLNQSDIDVSGSVKRLEEITGSGEIPKSPDESFIYEAESLLNDSEKINEALEEMFVILEKKYIKEEMGRVSRLLKKGNSDEEDSGALGKYQELSKKLVDIENREQKI